MAGTWYDEEDGEKKKGTLFFSFSMNMPVLPLRCSPWFFVSTISLCPGETCLWNFFLSLFFPPFLSFELFFDHVSAMSGCEWIE